jgi:membrane-bound lytic murein transglycosylase F
MAVNRNREVFADLFREPPARRGALFPTRYSPYNHGMTRLLFCLAFTGSLSLLSGCTESSSLPPMAEGEELVVVTRNSPTTYYFQGDRASGFEYGVIRAFAREYNMRVRIKVAFSLPELFDMLAGGEAHLAAAGLSQSAGRDARFVASNPYLHQQPLIVYKSGSLRPRSLEALVGRDMVVVAGSVHVETLSSLQQDLPELTWREIHAADSLELMQLVTDEKAELAIVDSIEFRIQQQLFPRVVAAMEIGNRTPVVWYLPEGERSVVSLELVNQFINRATEQGHIAQLEQEHFGRWEHASRVGSLTFQRKMRDDLPEWQPLLEQVAEEYQMDWRLLAAMAYQESHWDPNARSHTGVRGIMMLTRATASELGVEDRTDPEQSLRGGARFFKDLLRRLPSDIEYPDRTFLALAAYNIGMGHLEDARIMTQQAGGDPHLWPDVRAHLPKLQNPNYFSTTKFGFAEGEQAVNYVDNIRHFEGLLSFQNLPEHRISPPIQVEELLPDHLRRAELPVL